MNDLLKRKSAAIASFTKIGKSNGSAPPESTSNTFGVAYEFAIADALRSVANARYEAAKGAAIAAGVMKADYSSGKHIAYSQDGLAVIGDRNKDGTTIDSTAVQNELIKKLGAVEATKLIAKCEKPRKGAMKFSVSFGEE